MIARVAALLALAAAGCAASGPVRALAFQGQPFSLRHDDAPLSRAAAGGRITGRVCGMDLIYEVSPRGAGAMLQGFIDGQIGTLLEVKDVDGARSIEGYLGRSAGASTVELRLAGDRVAGRVGWRRFDLRAAGDRYQGVVKIT